eukprot:983932_1
MKGAQNTMIRLRKQNKRKRKRAETKSQSNNERMHPRNPYRSNPPNFAALAKKYPEFAKYVSIDKMGSGHIDWKDPYAVREVTRVLLKNDFHLDFDMPIDRLCPPVTQRLNYILWVEDLLALSPKSSETVRGIDIGTGASCIFPLLGHTSCG